MGHPLYIIFAKNKKNTKLLDTWIKRKDPKIQIFE